MPLISHPITPAPRPRSGSHLNGDGTHRRRGGDRTLRKSHAAATCPVCGRPMLECRGDCLTDAEAEQDYERRCESGAFTLDGGGKSVTVRKAAA